MLYAYALLVGILWGSTNALIKRGSERAAEKTKQRATVGVLYPWIDHVCTPSFFLPQLINQTGSALFIWLLGVSGKHLEHEHVGACVRPFMRSCDRE